MSKEKLVKKAEECGSLHLVSRKIAGRVTVPDREVKKTDFDDRSRDGG